MATDHLNFRCIRTGAGVEDGSSEAAVGFPSRPTKEQGLKIIEDDNDEEDFVPSLLSTFWPNGFPTPTAASLLPGSRLVMVYL